MQSANPRLTFGRPVRPPAEFTATKIWTDARYIYRYDAKRRICKRSPIREDVGVGTLYLPAVPKRPATPVLRRIPGAVRTLQVTLWLVIVAAFIVFVYPLWPKATFALQQWRHPAKPAASTATTARPTYGAAAAVPAYNRLYVPSIGVDTPIVEGSSLKVLNSETGVWHQTGSITNSNLVLAGHRFKYLPPNTSTLYDLDKLKVGATIEIDWLHQRHLYTVKQMEVVPATDVALLKPTVTPQLTLYSCNDVRMSHRVVAIAVPSAKP